MKNKIKSVLLDANRTDRFAMIHNGNLKFADSKTKSGIPFPECMAMIALPFAGGFDAEVVEDMAVMYLEQIQRAAK